MSSASNMIRRAAYQEVIVVPPCHTNTPSATATTRDGITPLHKVPIHLIKRSRAVLIKDLERVAPGLETIRTSHGAVIYSRPALSTPSSPSPSQATTSTSAKVTASTPTSSQPSSPHTSHPSHDRPLSPPVSAASSDNMNTAMAASVPQPTYIPIHDAMEACVWYIFYPSPLLPPSTPSTITPSPPSSSPSLSLSPLVSSPNNDNNHDPIMLPSGKTLDARFPAVSITPGWNGHEVNGLVETQNSAQQQHTCRPSLAGAVGEKEEEEEEDSAQSMGSHPSTTSSTHQGSTGDPSLVKETEAMTRHDPYPDHVPFVVQQGDPDSLSPPGSAGLEKEKGHIRTSTSTGILATSTNPGGPALTSLVSLCTPLLKKEPSSSHRDPLYQPRPHEPPTSHHTTPLYTHDNGEHRSVSRKSDPDNHPHNHKNMMIAPLTRSEVHDRVLSQSSTGPWSVGRLRSMEEEEEEEEEEDEDIQTELSTLQLDSQLQDQEQDQLPPFLSLSDPRHDPPLLPQVLSLSSSSSSSFSCPPHQQHHHHPHSQDQGQQPATTMDAPASPPPSPSTTDMDGQEQLRTLMEELARSTLALLDRSTSSASSPDTHNASTSPSGATNTASQEAAVRIRTLALKALAATTAPAAPTVASPTAVASTGTTKDDEQENGMMTPETTPVSTPVMSASFHPSPLQQQQQQQQQRQRPATLVLPGTILSDMESLDRRNRTMDHSLAPLHSPTSPSSGRLSKMVSQKRQSFLSIFSGHGHHEHGHGLDGSVNDVDQGRKKSFRKNKKERKDSTNPNSEPLPSPRLETSSSYSSSASGSNKPAWFKKHRRMTVSSPTSTAATGSILTSASPAAAPSSFSSAAAAAASAGVVNRSSSGSEEYLSASSAPLGSPAMSTPISTPVATTTSVALSSKVKVARRFSAPFNFKIKTPRRSSTLPLPVTDQHHQQQSSRPHAAHPPPPLPPLPTYLASSSSRPQQDQAQRRSTVGGLPAGRRARGGSVTQIATGSFFDSVSDESDSEEDSVQQYRRYQQQQEKQQQNQQRQAQRQQQRRQQRQYYDSDEDSTSEEDDSDEETEEDSEEEEEDDDTDTEMDMENQYRRHSLHSTASHHGYYHPPHHQGDDSLEELVAMTPRIQLSRHRPSASAYATSASYAFGGRSSMHSASRSAQQQGPIPPPLPPRHYPQQHSRSTFTRIPDPNTLEGYEHRYEDEAPPPAYHSLVRTPMVVIPTSPPPPIPPRPRSQLQHSPSYSLQSVVPTNSPCAVVPSSSMPSPLMTVPQPRLDHLLDLLHLFERHILDQFKDPSFLSSSSLTRSSFYSSSSPSSSSSSSDSPSLAPTSRKLVSGATGLNRRQSWLGRRPQTIASFAYILIELEQTGLLPCAMLPSWYTPTTATPSSSSSSPAIPSATAPLSPPSSPSSSSSTFSTCASKACQQSWLTLTGNASSLEDLARAMLVLEGNCGVGMMDSEAWRGRGLERRWVQELRDILSSSS